MKKTNKLFNVLERLGELDSIEAGTMININAVIDFVLENDFLNMLYCKTRQYKVSEELSSLINTLEHGNKIRESEENLLL